MVSARFIAAADDTRPPPRGRAGQSTTEPEPDGCNLLTLPGLMRDAIRKAWLFEPVAYLDHTLTSSDVTALVASAVMGLPALYLGARLSDPAIFGLSPTQLLLGLPLGVLVGAALMGSTAWMSAYLGVPGVRLLRPALGGLASWPAGLLRP